MTSNEHPIFRPHIVVIGIGGGGQNAVDRMLQQHHWNNVTFVAANTDLQVLQRSMAPIKLQLGPKKTRGQGAGAIPEVGEAAARESATEIYQLVKDAHLVFLTAGMGGGTGTGAIPVFAEIARKAGALVVAVVTLPFSWEGKRRRQNAEGGLAQLRQHVHTLITVPNDRLLTQEELSRIPLEASFFAADDVLRQGVQAITDLVIRPGLVNVDFADVLRLIQQGGTTTMTIGRGQGENRLMDALQRALHHPLLDRVPLHRAHHIIVNLTSPDAIGLEEFGKVMGYIHTHSREDVYTAFGIVQDPTMPEDTAEVILLVGGTAPDQTIDPAPATIFKGASPNPAPNPRPAPSRPVSSLPLPMNASSLDLPTFMRRRFQ